MAEHPSLSADAEEQLQQACAELSRRLRAGETCQAETLLHDFPSLASDPRLALDLILTEFRVRQQLGQTPDPQELLRRFPQWQPQLQQRLESLEAITTDEDSARTPLHRSLVYSLQAPAVLAPELGSHEVSEEIGRGGMGVVYRARDLVLDRPVALKVLRSGLLASNDEVARFYREARAAARLRHAHIVPILSMGLYRGQHCFTMPLFGGGTLTRHLARLRQDVRAGVAVVEKVARAVQAAHEHGIIHRDLKPGNILLDEQGEPHVSDFGLAKLLDAPADTTISGQVLGTPAYMAPEQAAGQSGKASPATDVWALGVILYEMLVGTRPWKGVVAPEISPQVLHADPPRPRQLNPQLPRALEIIVLKCLEKKPARRFTTAGALADDLRSWLAGRRIAARPPSPWRGVRRFVGRHAATLLVVLLFAGLLAFLGLRKRQPDPSPTLEQQVASQLNTIEQGGVVVLVGESGPPADYRWVVDPATILNPRANNGLFTFHSMTLTELELLPSVPRTSYRFRAQVRHEDSARMGRVGIYCLRRPHETPQGTEHLQVDLTFNEHDRSDPKKNPPDAAFHLHRFRTTGGPGSKNETAGPLARALPTLQRKANDKARWHDLVVEVRPDRLRALVDEVEVGVLNLKDQAMYQAGLFNFERPPDVPLVPSPQGGLGLFAHRGAAAFRNVIVEPLEPDKK